MPAAPIPPYETASARASPWKRALLMSVAGHLALVLLLIIGPLLARLLRPPPKREMITFVELAPLPPAPPPPAPTQEPEQRKPEPHPTPIPEKPPERPKPPEKPKIQVSTNRIVRKPEPQPRPQPQQPELTPEQIRKLLEANIRFTPIGTPAAAGTPATNVTDLTTYYAAVRDAMYAAWTQPSAVARGLRAEVSIRVLRNGAVTQRRLTRSSGSQLMDDSLMQAVNSVSMLRPLPPEVRDPHLDITIEFVVGE
jgi:protein TonB